MGSGFLKHWAQHGSEEGTQERNVMRPYSQISLLAKRQHPEYLRKQGWAWFIPKLPRQMCLPCCETHLLYSLDLWCLFCLLDASNSTKATVESRRGVWAINSASLCPSIYQLFTCSTTVLPKTGRGRQNMRVTSPEKTYVWEVGASLSPHLPSTSSQFCFLFLATLSGKFSSSSQVNFHSNSQNPLSLPFPVSFLEFYCLLLMVCHVCHQKGSDLQANMAAGGPCSGQPSWVRKE